MTYQLHHGNCIDILPLIERESVDAIVTDPPYGLDFMGKDWDHGVPGEHFWREAYRCVKPGAYLLAFGGTRTFHRLAVAIEDAGWEIRDDIALLASMDDKQRAFFASLNPDQQQAFLDTFASDKTMLWVTGQGFPKSHDVSKAIDREAGAEREVIGRRHAADGTPIGGRRNAVCGDGWKRPWRDKPIEEQGQAWDTSPATPAAAEWDGWGTALKPAWEPIIVARKPMQGTVAENVQRYGTGAMNIDACRIGNDEIETGRAGRSNGSLFNASIGDKQMPHVGRWPANLIHDGSAEVLAGFPMTTSAGASGYNFERSNNANASHFITNIKSGVHHGDTGSAARFFYCAKASKQDRDEGLEGLEDIDPAFGNDKGDGLGRGISHTRQDWPRKNGHPTVKPTALMRYLCRLVTPPQGVILDPFMGSGSTGKAAMLEGFNFIGIDTEIEYVEIAARRIEHACEKVGIVIEQPMMFDTQREMVDRPKQLILL